MANYELEATPSTIVIPKIRSLGEDVTDELFVPVTIFTGQGSLVSSRGVADPVAVPLGSNGQVLTVDTSIPSGIKWAPPTGDVALFNLVQHQNLTTSVHGISDTADLHSDNDFTLKGQLIVGSGSGNSVVINPGSLNQVLSADPATASGLKWATVSGGGVGGSIDAAVALSADSGTRNVIIPTAVGYVPLTIKTMASQTADAFVVKDSADAIRVQITGDGLMTRHIVANAFGGSWATRIQGDTADRVVMSPNGMAINFGPGNAASDTNIYRASANNLKTDDTFRSALDIHARDAIQGQVSIGGSSAGSIELGSATANIAAQSPFIDFHFAPGGTWASQDYNIRIQNGIDGRLSILSKSARQPTEWGYVHITDGVVDVYPLINSAAATRNTGLYVYTPLDNNLTGNEYRGIIEGHCVYTRTNVSPPTQMQYAGITSKLEYGGSATIPTVAASGTTHCFTGTNIIKGSNNAGNEHGVWVSFQRYENGATGRSWGTDWNLHGPVNAQMSLLSMQNIFMNNYYNGSPSASLSYGSALMTAQGAGGGTEGSTAHQTGTTYPNDVGYWVMGHSGSGGATQGWKTAFKVGGAGGGWNISQSRIGTGLLVNDYEVAGADIAGRKSGTGPGIRIRGGMDLQLDEGAAPASVANTARLFARDNGSGTTQLCVMMNGVVTVVQTA